MPPPSGPAKQRTGALLADRGGRTTRRRRAAEGCRVPDAGPAGAALHRPGCRVQLAGGQEPPDARLGLGATGMRRVQLGHRRLDVDPLGRPRGPRQGPNNLSRSRDTAPASFPRVCVRRSSSSARVSTSTARSAASSCPSTCRASASSRPAACCSSSFKPSRTISNFSFGKGVVVQRLLRLLDTLQHMPDPSEGGVVPRVALDLAPGVGDGTDAADRLPGCPLEPP